MKLQEPFGICQNYPRLINAWHLSHDLEIIRKMGIRWLRTDFDWRKIEPKRGEKKYRWYDALVRLCQLKQIKLVPVLVYSPKWVAPRFNFPPEDLSHFSDFVRSVVGRYSHFIKHWEIWNEANSYFFWVGDPKQYASMLNTASLSAKSVDADCKILFSGLADAATPNLSFLFDVLRYLDQNSLDIINLHAYPGTWNRRKIEEWPSLLGKQAERLATIGMRKPIWITETGLTSQENDSTGKESMQDSYLIRAFSSLLGSGEVEKVFWYCLKDERSSKSEEQFGLLTQSSVADNSRLVNRAYSRLSRTLPLQASSLGGKFFRDRPKPAFKSYSDLIRLLGHKFENISSEFEDGSATVSFAAPTYSVKIGWNERTGYLPEVSISGSDAKLRYSKILGKNIGRIPSTIISRSTNKNKN